MGVKEFITNPDSKYGEGTVRLFKVISNCSLVSSLLGITSYNLNNLITSTSPIPIEVLHGSLVLYCIWLSFKVSYLDKDLTQIKKLYADFLKEYNKLNKEFDFVHPIQVYKLFEYMLYNGFLSTGKEFRYDNKNCVDIPYYCGSSVITGTGTCRHISALLTDILNDYGLSSSQIGVDTLSLRENLNCILHIILSPKKYQNYLDQIFGHAITATLYNGDLYFLDPTWKEIGARYGRDICVYGNGTTYELYKISRLETTLEKYTSTPSNLRKKDIFSLSNPVDNLYRIARKTQLIIDDETGRLEQFYIETKDLREELADRTLSLKPPKKRV